MNKFLHFKHRLLLALLAAFLAVPQAWADDNPISIGTSTYATLDEAIAAANDGDEIDINKAGTYHWNGIGKNITNTLSFVANVDSVIIEHRKSGDTDNDRSMGVFKNATFKNVTFDLGTTSVTYHGFYTGSSITMEKCQINGLLFSYGDMTFTNCTFNQTAENYNMWVYGDGTVTYDSCTFNTAKGALNIYCEPENKAVNSIKVKNCTFNATKETTKTPLNIKTAGCSHTIKIYGANKVNDNFKGTDGNAAVTSSDRLWMSDAISPGSNSVAYVDENGKENLVYGNVAQVLDADGNTVGTYASLAEAVSGATDAQTVQLLADITGQNTTLTINKSLTLDLNGHTLSGSGALLSSTLTQSLLFINGADITVTIKDTNNGETEGEILTQGTPTKSDNLNKFSCVYLKQGTLTLTGGKITVENESNTNDDERNVSIIGIVSPLTNDVVINLNGGTVSATGKGDNVYGIRTLTTTVSTNSTISIKGGKVNASGANSVYGIFSYVPTTIDERSEIKANATGNYAYGIDINAITKSTGSLTVNGGNITAFANNNATAVAIPFNKWQYVVANINGGTLSANAKVKYAVGIQSYGNVTIANSANITASSTDGSYVYGVEIPHGTTKIQGGSIKANAARYTYACWVGGHSGYTGGTLEISDGTINSESSKSTNSTYGVYVGKVKSGSSYGTATISGGTITATAGAVNSIINAVYVEASDDNGAPKCTINGGYIYGASKTSKTESDIDSLADKANFKISGGYFAHNTYVSSYLADGKAICAGNSDYPYQVATAVAKIGDDTNYASLQEAFDAATEGQTITLANNASGNGVILYASQKKNLTLDLNGHTYTVSGKAVGSKNTENQAFHFEKGNTVTIKNGKLTSTSSEVIMFIQNYSNLTLDGVTVDATNIRGTYAVSNNCGSLTTSGATTITAPAGGVAFDVYYWYPYYREGVSVTINEGTKINGKIEYDAPSSSPDNWEEKTNLNINGGTFSNFSIELYNTTTPYKAGITISGGTFDAAVNEDYCAADFVPAGTTDSQGNVTYGVTAATVDNAISYKESEAGETKFMTGSHITIDDTGSNFYSFKVPSDMTGKTITYTRNFSNTNYKAWFVPFEVSAVNDSVEFYELANVNSTVDENQVNSGDWYIVLNPVTSGTVEANKPYVIKPKYAGKVTFTVENAAVYKLGENVGENAGSLSQTTLDRKVKLTLQGNYKTKTVSADDYGWYAFSSGKFSLQTANSIGHTLPPMRFYLTITDADGNSISSAKNYQVNMFVDDDPTGISGVETNVEPVNEVIYDLQGRRVTNPSKGIYIINGKKVIIK